MLTLLLANVESNARAVSTIFVKSNEVISLRICRCEDPTWHLLWIVVVHLNHVVLDLEVTSHRITSHFGKLHNLERSPIGR